MFGRGRRLTATVATVAALSACGQTNKYDQARAAIENFPAKERFQHDFQNDRTKTGDAYIGQSCLKDTVFTLEDEGYSQNRRPASAEIADLGDGKIDVKSTAGTVLHLVIRDSEHALDVHNQDPATIATLKGYDCQPGSPFRDTAPENQ